MKQMNLLPKHIHEARRRRKLIRGGATAGIVCLILGVTWAGIAFVQTRQLDRRWQSLQTQVQQVRQQRNELAALKKRNRQIRDELARYERLRLPLPPSSVVCLISQTLPPSLALDRITLKTEPPALTTSTASKSRKRKTSASSPAPRPPLELKLSGAATSDIAVAGFVRLLSEQPVFEAVKLVSSRQIESDGRSLQQFVITAQIPMERRFLIAQAQGGDNVQ